VFDAQRRRARERKKAAKLEKKKGSGLQDEQSEPTFDGKYHFIHLHSFSFST
jgi:hypothetical protein